MYTLTHIHLTHIHTHPHTCTFARHSYTHTDNLPHTASPRQPLTGAYVRGHQCGGRLGRGPVVKEEKGYWTQSQSDWQQWRRNKKEAELFWIFKKHKYTSAFQKRSAVLSICKIHSHSFPFSLQQIFRIYRKTFYVASGEARENQQDVGRIWPYPQ